MSTNPRAWNAFLEALHSSLIDVINERLPKEKPELGLPIKQSTFAWPSETVDRIVTVEVSFEKTGAAFLALSPGGAKLLKLEPIKVWEEVVKKSTPDFIRRAISPRFGKTAVWSREDAAGASKLELGKIIWFPFKIRGEACLLGVGI